MNASFVFIAQKLKELGRPDPSRDWIAMLTIAAVAFVGVVLWHGWIFWTVVNGGVITTESATPSADATLSIPSLEGVQRVFDTRAAEEQKYVTGVYRYADPSQ